MMLLAPLLAEPTQFTLLAALRLIEESAAGGSRLGEASVMADDPVRIEQLPSMGLQGSDVARAEMRAGTLWLTQYAFGNLASHGALPTHLLQLVHSRTEQMHDRTLVDFINWFQHRFAELFYRAYADGVPTAPGGQLLRDRFRQYFAALTGVPIEAGGVGRLPAEGLLGRGASLGPAPRSAEVLEHLVGEYFGSAGRGRMLLRRMARDSAAGAAAVRARWRGMYVGWWRDARVSHVSMPTSIHRVGRASGGGALANVHAGCAGGGSTF